MNAYPCRADSGTGALIKVFRVPWSMARCDGLPGSLSCSDTMESVLNRIVQRHRTAKYKKHLMKGEGLGPDRQNVTKERKLVFYCESRH
jgi:hypothetical protein